MKHKEIVDMMVKLHLMISWAYWKGEKSCGNPFDEMPGVKNEDHCTEHNCKHYLFCKMQHKYAKILRKQGALT